jgi:hypothetical protein
MDRRATRETGQTRRIVERERRVENRRHRNQRGTVWARKEVNKTRKGKGKERAASKPRREARDYE